MNFMINIFSITRIAATFGIYFFHCLGLLGYCNKGIDFVSILFFCFLTGFFSANEKTRPHGIYWLYRRLVSIMIPYWFVILPVIVINWLVGYKQTSYLSDLITFLGGNLFLDDPIYVIAWYITFVNILYLFVFIYQKIDSIPVKFVFWGLGFLVFSTMLNKTSYFLSFSLGYFLTNQVRAAFSKEHNQLKGITCFLFWVQKRCYAFFLVHGAVLIALYHIVKMEGYQFVGLGFLMSCLAALILYRLTTPVIGLLLSVFPKKTNIC